MSAEHDDDCSCDDCYPSALKPYWSRRRRIAHKVDEIYVLCGALAGSALTFLVMWKLLR